LTASWICRSRLCESRMALTWCSRAGATQRWAERADDIDDAAGRSSGSRTDCEGGGSRSGVLCRKMRLTTHDVKCCWVRRSRVIAVNQRLATETATNSKISGRFRDEMLVRATFPRRVLPASGSLACLLNVWTGV
jgi:hypothetical protein